MMSQLEGQLISPSGHVVNDAFAQGATFGEASMRLAQSRTNSLWRSRCNDGGLCVQSVEPSRRPIVREVLEHKGRCKIAQADSCDKRISDPGSCQNLWQCRLRGRAEAGTRQVVTWWASYHWAHNCWTDDCRMWTAMYHEHPGARFRCRRQ